MKKIKKFFKKKYSLCLICALFSFLVISSTFINNSKNKTVYGASTVLEQEYYYVLPQVQLSSQSSASAVLPTSLFSTTINNQYPDLQVPILYTLTGSNPSTSWRYVKRTFIQGVYPNNYDVSYAPYVIFPGNGSTISSAQFGTNVTHNALYYNRTGTPFVIYSYGRVTVNQVDTTSTRIQYELCTDNTFNSTNSSDSYVNIRIFYLPAYSSSNYNYTVNFNPTYISSSGASSLGYNEGFNVGYSEGQSVGYDTGYSVGYNNGINDSNVFTFSNLISAVIDVPINSFKSLLNFNFLDINLLDFALSIITLFVVVKVVQLINGG